ncbi:hypothetical protein [Streptomyces sp. KS_5]|uniref:hypothetical protein n=1 Tax=Streptomyces sp. KS_5 TaxID=1881018 RepID=UPI00089B22E1|nr:hypothetical protein [Streptomyces sp. KS_5]SEE13473.1 hypothetical protein SAMN05428938_7206 [Streptomyces sp. KS_5]
MKRRAHAICTTAITVLAVAGPASHPAHARGDLNCRDFVFQEDAQAEFNRDMGDPNHLDEDQGADDGIACEVLPRRSTIDSPLPAVSPLPTITPLPTLSPPPTSSPRPTQGVRGGLGGATGPADFELVLGAGLAVGALALAAGYVVVRRRRHR